MKKKLFSIIVTGLFLLLAIGIATSANANIFDEKQISTANDEESSSMTINFVTNKGEEYDNVAFFVIELKLSIPRGKNYYEWVRKEEIGPTSIEFDNLPSGLYILRGFSFGGGYVRYLPKLVFLGQGRLIPAHKNVTVKVIDLSYP